MILQVLIELSYEEQGPHEELYGNWQGHAWHHGRAERRSSTAKTCFRTGIAIFFFLENDKSQVI